MPVTLFADAIVPTSYYVRSYLFSPVLVLLALALFATAAVAIILSINKKRKKRS